MAIRVPNTPKPAVSDADRKPQPRSRESRPQVEQHTQIYGGMRPSSEPGMQNQRIHPRTPLETAIDLHSDSNFFTGFSTNISEGGIFVATVHIPKIGTLIDLSFSIPGGPRVSVHGTVHWIRESNEKTPEIFPGVGVQFVNLPPEVALQLRKFIAEREPMFYPD